MATFKRKISFENKILREKYLAVEKGKCHRLASINRITNANYEKEAFAVIVDGKRRPFFLASGYMLASVGDIGPMSEKVFYVYLNKNKKNQIPNVKGDYASGILSDYKADAAASADVENFGKIMNSATNLLKNPSFEIGTESWGGTMDTERVAAKIVEGGLYGERSAMLEIKIPKIAPGTDSGKLFPEYQAMNIS